MSLILRKEAEIKGINAQNIAYNVSAFAEDSLKEITLITKKEKRPSKEEIVQQEDAINLSISGKDIMASYEYTSIIAYLVQFYESNVMPIPCPEENKKGPEPIQKNQIFIDIFGSRLITLSGINLFKRTDYFRKDKNPNYNFKQMVLKKMLVDKETGKLRELKLERIMKKKLRKYFMKKENNYYDDSSNRITFDLINHSNSFNLSASKENKTEGVNALERLKCLNHIFSQNVQFFNEPDIEITKLKSDHSQLFEDIKFITKRKR